MPCHCHLLSFKVMTWMVPCEWLKTMKPTHKLLFVLCPMLVLGFIYYSSGKLHLHVWGQKPRKWHLQSDCNHLIIHLSFKPTHIFICVFGKFCLTPVSVLLYAFMCTLPVHRSFYFSLIFIFIFIFVVSLLNCQYVSLCVCVSKPVCLILI